MDRPTQPKNLLWAVIIYGTITVIIFSPYLFFNKTFIPSDLQSWILPWSSGEPGKVQNHYLCDVIAEHYPWKYLLKEGFKEGTFPLWNPYNFFGVPQVSISTPIYFDIFNTLYLISSSLIIDALIAAIKVFLAGLFLFILMQYYRVSFIGSLLSGLAFMLNGSFLNMHTFYWTIGAFLWLPLVVLLLEKSLEPSSNTRFLVGAGVILGLSHLGGHLQTSLQIFIALFLWMCGKVLVSYRDKKISLLRIYLNLLVCYIISILISAVIFLPIVEFFFAGASRSYLVWDWFMYLPRNLLKIPFIVSFFIPNFFGHNSIFSAVSITGEKWTSYLMGYIGFIPLVLAIIAMLFIKNKVVKTFRFIALGILLILFLTPLVTILYFRSLLIWCFAAAVLAGFGLDFILQEENAGFLFRAAKIIFGFLIVLCIGLIVAQIGIFALGNKLIPKFESYIASRALSINPVFSFAKQFYIDKVSNTFRYYSIGNFRLLLTLGLIAALAIIFMALANNKLSKTTASRLILLFTLIDLTYFFFLYMPVIDLGRYPLYPETGSSNYLHRDKTLYRAMAIVAPGIDPPIYHFESNIPHKIPMVQHCGSLNYSRLVKFQDDFALTTPNFNPIIASLGNVKYFLTKSIELDARYPLVYKGEIKIFKNDKVLPRAFTVTGYRIISSPDGVIEAMKSPEFNPGNEVLLEEKPAQVLSDSNLKVSKIDIIKYGFNYVKLHSQTDGNALLILTDTNYPGWEASVDGRNTRIYNADYIFRAIYLPKGKHAIEFNFRPFSFRLGLGISIFALFLSVSYIFLMNKKQANIY